MLKANIIVSKIMSIEPMRRQSLVTLISQILLTLIGFLSTMYFSRTVGASILGAYFLFIAYFELISLFGDGGLGGAAVKRISEAKEANEYYSAFAVARVFLQVVAILALLVVRPLFVDLDNSGLFSWLILALILGVFSTITLNGIYGSNKVGIFQVTSLLKNFGRVIFQVIAVYLGYSTVGLAGGFIFGMILSIAICLRFLRLRFTGFEYRHFQNLLAFSFWTFLISGGSLIFSYADTVIIGYFLQNSDVGIYRVAFQFTTAATFTTIAMRTVLYPKVSNWFCNDRAEMAQSALSKGFTYSLMLAVPVFVGGVLLGAQMLHFFYGEEFASGSSVLFVLLLVQIANVFVFLQTMYLNALDRPKDAFKVTGIASVANILLDILLIPVMGIMGAAVATLLTMALNASLAYRVLSKFIDVRLESYSVRNIILSSLLMATFIFLYEFLVPLSNVWLTLLPVLIGAVIYALMLIKLDKNIYSEFRALIEHLNVPWVSYL